MTRPTKERAGHSAGSIRGVLLWDVDGTLVTRRRQTPSLHSDLVREYFGEVRGTVPDTTGLTDFEILRDMSPSTATQLDLYTLLNSLDRRYGDRLREGDLEVLPGVSAALRLAEETGWLNALQTGNTARRAALKLDSVALREWFSIECSSFGNLAGDRGALVGRAKQRVVQLLGACTPLLVIGDTPRDAVAAVQHGIPMLAVETGGFGRQVLHQSGARYVVSDLKGGAGEFATVLANLRTH